jgi:hypothetical protein
MVSRSLSHMLMAYLMYLFVLIVGWYTLILDSK